MNQQKETQIIQRATQLLINAEWCGRITTHVETVERLANEAHEDNPLFDIHDAATAYWDCPECGKEHDDRDGAVTCCMTEATAYECGGCGDVHAVESDAVACCGNGSGVALIDIYTCPICEDKHDDRHSAIICCDLDPEYRSPCEYELVSPWLAHCLREHGEVVIDTDIGWVWARQDYVIYGSHILESIAAETYYRDRAAAELGPSSAQ